MNYINKVTMNTEVKSNRMVKSIRTIWYNQTKDSNGYFIRWLDGNTLNNNVTNLCYCSPIDAFSNPDWMVDWNLDLSTKQTIFVKDNISNFAMLYTPE